MLVKVCGRSPNTLAAKTRDLATFIAWFVEHRGHGDIDRWTEAENALLFALHDKSWQTCGHRQPSAVHAEALCALGARAARRRSLHDTACRWPRSNVSKSKSPNARSSPMNRWGRFLRPRVRSWPRQRTPSRHQAPPEAAEHTGAAPTAGAGRQSRARPRRNLALLGVLYYSGLRVSEVIDLTRAQYDGAALYDVARKGGRQARKLVLHPECARLIDDYLTHERERDVADLDSATSNSGAADASRPLFASARTGGRVDRIRIGRILARLATRAATLPNYTGGSFSVHAHRLRHTFGAAYRAASGSDTETAAALGHAGLQYVGRYVRQTDAERLGMLNARATGALTRLYGPQATRGMACTRPSYATKAAQSFCDAPSQAYSNSSI